ncbi:MAG: hypothetical protein HY392_04850 [Candidatus Diapherotrites archaeon]|nr:hypothetical protein [Candidatus Diapherotrites archaeon]
MVRSIKKRKDKKRSPQKKAKSFFDLKPWDWGKESENSSLEIDKIVYGGKK